MDHIMSTPVSNTNSKRFRKDDERVNPFERHLLNRLHEPIWSPSVLNCTSTSSSSEMSNGTPPQRIWAIEQIAKLNPTRIEESPSTHQTETILDAQSEAEVQAAISQFFSSSELIAPSPYKSEPTPPSSTPASSDLNTSIITRRKLDFTFEMECEFFDSEDEADGHLQKIPIASIIESMESSNGRTFNSPNQSVST